MFCGRIGPAGLAPARLAPRARPAARKLTPRAALAGSPLDVPTKAAATQRRHKSGQIQIRFRISASVGVRQLEPVLAAAAARLCEAA
jgi:hypothetical protein